MSNEEIMLDILEVLRDMNLYINRGMVDNNERRLFDKRIEQIKANILNPEI